MAYAAQSDLVPLRLTQTELGQLCVDPATPPIDPTSSQGLAIIAQVSGAALEEASGKVDSYCRARYQTPLQVGDDVKGLTLDIALYLLFSRRRNAKMTETIRQRYDDAIAFLKDISNSKASLDQPASQAQPQETLAGPQISCKDRKLTFREEHLEGFV